MRKRLFIIAAFLCVMPGILTVLAAQNYSNEDLTSRYISQQDYASRQRDDSDIIDLTQKYRLAGTNPNSKSVRESTSSN